MADPVPQTSAEFTAGYRAGLEAAAAWHESRLPFWRAEIEKRRAEGDQHMEHSACCYHNAHTVAANVVRDLRVPGESKL